jgi:lipopolysaccharide export system protein LptC
MKHWPSHLFPLVVLLLLAGMSFWLRAVLDGEATGKGEPQHIADAWGENVTIRRFDAAGQLKYRLTSPQLTHFPDDDTSQLRDPTLTAYRSDGPDIQVRADNGVVSSQGQTVYLWDKVAITRAAYAGQLALTASMPDLTALPDAGTASTGSPVEIVQGKSTLTGVGLQIDNNASTLVLQSRVRGTYIRPGTQP